MYNNSYYRNYIPNYNNTSEPVLLEQQIDNQINQLNQMKNQMKNNQQPAINQTFQLAPTNNHMKYANTIDDVDKEIVYYETPFFSKDMSVLWVKNTQNKIKTYELNEIVPKDEKDIQIEFLQSQLDELKGMIKNDANVTNDDAKQSSTNTTTNDEPTRTTVEKAEPTSISKISTSKKK